MDSKKTLPFMVAIVMLASAFGSLFSHTSDDVASESTDNFSEVGDAIGFGGEITHEDLLKIFSKNGGDDWSLTGEKIAAALISGSDLFPGTSDLNGDSNTDDEDQMIRTYYIVYSVLKALEEKLGLEMSAAISVYGMAEIIEKNDSSYIARLDAALKADMSLQVRMGQRIAGDIQIDEDGLYQLLANVIVSLFPEISEEDKEKILDTGGFRPELMEDGEMWLRLDASFSAAAAGYVHLLKEGEGPMCVSSLLLDVRAAADVKLTTNASLGLTMSSSGPAIDVGYPGGTWTYGARGSLDASVQQVFSKTAPESVLPKFGVTSEEGKTKMHMTSGSCNSYSSATLSASAEVYGNGMEKLSFLLGMLPEEIANDGVISYADRTASIDDDTGEPESVYEIVLGENSIEVSEDGAPAMSLSYDPAEGEYTLDLDGDLKTFKPADKTAPTPFSLLMKGSIILDGEGKKRIAGAVDSVRNGMPSIQPQQCKVVFVNSDTGKKFAERTVSAGGTLDSFPVLPGGEGNKLIGWTQDPGGHDLRFVTKDTAITQNMILYSVVASDKSDDLSFAGTSSSSETYQRIKSPDDYDAAGFFRGHRYVDLYDGDALVCRWYFHFGTGYDAENLKVRVASADPSETAKSRFGSREMVLLDFEASGKMPNKTQVSFNVGGALGSGLFEVYEVTEDDFILRSYGSTQEGMATFEISHCSEYLLVKADRDPAAANMGTSSAPSSDSTLLYVGAGAAVAVVAVGAVLFLRRH